MKYGRAGRHPGPTRIKLAELLAEKGIVVSPYDLWVQEGGYRHRNWDLARWGSNHARWATGKDPEGHIYHLEIHLCSWSRMTDCVKHGIEISNFDGEYKGAWHHVGVEHAATHPLNPRK